MKTKFSLVGIIFLFLFVSLNSSAQTYKYTVNWGQNGFNIVDSKASELEIVYSVEGFLLVENDFNGEKKRNISLEGMFLFNDAGMPDLPANSGIIAIPTGSHPILEVLDVKYETIKDVDIAPAPIIPFDTEEIMVYEKNNKVYTRNEFYPANPIQIPENF